MESTQMTESQALAAKVAEHLMNGGAVMVKSYTRPTVYTSKHVTMFRASSRETDRGIYIGWPGRKSAYVTPEMLAFSR
jgi:hypothetical protein